MIRARIRQNKLAGPLQRLEHLDPVGLQIRRRHHGRDVVENIRIFLEKKGALFLDNAVELLSVALWHAIPQLGLAPVIVVNGR